MTELKQCPYEKACQCKMDEPCQGCETLSESLNRTALAKVRLKLQLLVDGLEGFYPGTNGTSAAIITVTKDGVALRIEA